MPTVCLVTGGAGFIGCALSAGLVSRFDTVIALDNLHPQVHARRERPAALDPVVQLIIGDVMDPAIWDTLLAKYQPTTVIHLAAETGTGQSLTESSRHVGVNLMGTSTMLDAFVRHKIVPQNFVLTSSRAVYGEGIWLDAGGHPQTPGLRDKAQLEARIWDFPGLTFQPFRADLTPATPTNIYAATKLAQEHILSAWAQAFGARLDIARLQNVYGPGQALQNPYTGIISLFARLSHGRQQIDLYEDGEMQRDFVFINDVVSALLAAIDQPSAKLRRFDVGLGQRHTIRDAAMLLSKRYDAPAPRVSGAFRHGDVRHAGCTLEATQAVLNWAPAYPLDMGLNLLCDWVEQQ